MGYYRFICYYGRSDYCVGSPDVVAVQEVQQPPPARLEVGVFRLPQSVLLDPAGLDFVLLGEGVDDPGVGIPLHFRAGLASASAAFLRDAFAGPALDVLAGDVELLADFGDGLELVDEHADCVHLLLDGVALVGAAEVLPVQPGQVGDVIVVGLLPADALREEFRQHLGLETQEVSVFAFLLHLRLGLGLLLLFLHGSWLVDFLLFYGAFFLLES